MGIFDLGVLLGRQQGRLIPNGDGIIFVLGVHRDWNKHNEDGDS